MANDVEPLPGYPEPYGLLCAVLQDGTSDWRGELWGAEIGPDVTAWRPRPGGQSIGAILLHMVIVEIFWFECFVLGQRPSDEDKRTLLWDEIDVDEGRWPDPPAQPIQWYFDLFDRVRSRSLERIRQWPPPATLVERNGMSRTPRWVLGHVIQHEAYHGGQVVMLYDLWANRNV